MDLEHTIEISAPDVHALVFAIGDRNPIHQGPAPIAPGKLFLFHAQERADDIASTIDGVLRPYNTSCAFKGFLTVDTPKQLKLRFGKHDTRAREHKPTGSLLNVVSIPCNIYEDGNDKPLATSNFQYVPAQELPTPTEKLDVRPWIHNLDEGHARRVADVLGSSIEDYRYQAIGRASQLLYNRRAALTSQSGFECEDDTPCEEKIAFYRACSFTFGDKILYLNHGDQIHYRARYDGIKHGIHKITVTADKDGTERIYVAEFSVLLKETPAANTADTKTAQNP